MSDTMYVILWSLQSLQSIAPILQTIILAITGWIVWRYTRETKRLREVGQQQVQETQRQIELQLRPFLVVLPSWLSGTLGSFCVSNIGNGAAINIAIIRGKSLTHIPF